VNVVVNFSLFKMRTIIKEAAGEHDCDAAIDVDIS
jgi:hypothetical protein